MAVKNPLRYARQLLQTLVNDRDEHLLRADGYLHGIQDDPYMPENADAEYRLLAERAVTNVMGFAVDTFEQALFVDSFRRGRPSDRVVEPSTDAVQPEWDHFQASSMDSRQSAIYRGAISCGQSFVLTERRPDRQVRSKGLSALGTSALFADPANDLAPAIALCVTQWPKSGSDKKTSIPGIARMWDDTFEYVVTFKSATSFEKGVTVKPLKRHGASECPVTRFAGNVDLEGRTWGVVERGIPLQNRLNQTIFDMLVVQSFASFKVRTISGMAPPLKMQGVDEDGEVTTDPDAIVQYIPRLDSQGRTIPEDVNLNARRFFFAEDPETRFSTLDETQLDGFIAAVRLAFEHIAALYHIPPHYMLGKIADLSAEAMTAAETSWSRTVEGLKRQFGESWERVFRIAAELNGDAIGAGDLSGEIVWRDMENRSMSALGDALGKMAESLGIPKRGLWARVPNVTATELAEWEAMYEEESVNMMLVNQNKNPVSASSPRPTYRARDQVSQQ